MFHLDSGYTIDSAVGPVYDLTKWTGRGRIGMGIAVLTFGIGFLAAAAFVWDSSLFFEKPPAELKDAVADMNDAWRTHTVAMKSGVGVAALLGVLCLLGASTLFSDAFRDDYFFRAGPQGLWLRLPNGFSWQHLGLVSKPLELELNWSDIANIEVTQTKQFGSLSRNAGNICADMTLRTRSDQTYVLPLDGLEAAAYLIHERLTEARQGGQRQGAGQENVAAAIGDGSWRTP
ncbi:MAG: hypothetical protein WD875_14685 [Pirellulales bacterium]